MADKYQIIRASQELQNKVHSPERWHIVDSQGNFVGAANTKQAANQIISQVKTGKVTPIFKKLPQHQQFFKEFVDHYESLKNPSVETSSVMAEVDDRGKGYARGKRYRVVSADGTERLFGNKAEAQKFAAKPGPASAPEPRRVPNMSRPYVSSAGNFPSSPINKSMPGIGKPYLSSVGDFPSRSIAAQQAMQARFPMREAAPPPMTPYEEFGFPKPQNPTRVPQFGTPVGSPLPPQPIGPPKPAGLGNPYLSSVGNFPSSPINGRPMPGTGTPYLSSVGNFPSSPIGGQPTGFFSKLGGLVDTGSTPWLTRAGYASGARGATTAALRGAAGRALGSAFLGEFAGNQLDQSNLFGKDSTVNNAVSAALKGAGYGAAVGSFLPISTPVTALIGAGLGAGYSLLKGNDGGGGDQTAQDVSFNDRVANFQQQYGLDAEKTQNVIDRFDFRMQMAADSENPGQAEQDAKNLASSELQDLVLSTIDQTDTNAQTAFNPTDALAMQALIGNYVKPYSDMYVQSGKDIANAYEQVAATLGDPQLAARARAYGADAQNYSNLQAGTLMAAGMTDPMLAAAKNQSDMLSQLNQQTQARAMAAQAMPTTSSTSSLLG